MSTYVIGDVHGCYKELKELLVALRFNPLCDKALFVGDLVGRGPQPREVLDCVMDMGPKSVNVLGNHDLRLLAMAYDLFPVEEDVRDIFTSPNLDHYVAWLSSSKIIYIDSELPIVITHAGIPPGWGIESSVKKYADHFESTVKNKGIKKTLEIIYADTPLTWQDGMSDEAILQYTAFAFTKLKFCHKDGRFDTHYQCAPGQQPFFLTPWFCLRSKNLNDNYTIMFGHWAALGIYSGHAVICCDSGCVWGEKLTAIKISPDTQVYQIKSSYNANKKYIKRNLMR